MTTTTISRLPKKLQAAIKSLPEVQTVPGKACCVTIDPDASAIAFTRGKSYCHRTKGGRIIHHPSAYKKRGWSNIVYHAAEPQSLTLPLAFAVQHGYIPEGYFGPLVALVIASAISS